jgi:hypothetical protein
MVDKQETKYKAYKEKNKTDKLYQETNEEKTGKDGTGTRSRMGQSKRDEVKEVRQGERDIGDWAGGLVNGGWQSIIDANIINANSS